MRTFFGMVLGCLLTVAAAYVHDSMVAPTAANGTTGASNTLVNWDVAARRWGQVKETAHSTWLKLQEATQKQS